MNILQKIRTKASQALTGVGNFIDRDKSMPGVQLAKGGLMNRIADTQVGGHRLADQVRAYPEAFSQNLPFTPDRQENFNRNVGDIFGEKSIPTTLAQGFNNWVGAPLAQVPYNLRETFAPGKTKMERIGSAANVGFGLLPGVEDAAIAGLNSVKAAAAKRNLSGLQEGLVGNEYTGLGDAVTGGKEGLATDLLNVAELPLLVVGGLKAGGIKSVDDSLQNLKNVDGKATTQAVGNVVDDVGKQADTIVKKVVEKTGEVPLDKLFKGKSKAAKAAREELKVAATNADINPGNKLTNFFRKTHLDAKDDLKRTFGELYDKYIDPIYQKHTQRLADADRAASAYHERLKPFFNILGTADDKLLHELRKKGGYKTLERTLGKEKAQELKAIYESLREMYKEMYAVAKQNRSGAKNLAEKLDMPKELDDFLSQVGSGKSRGIMESMLSGGIESTDPISKTIFKKQRAEATMGAVESMLNYIEYWKRAAYTDMTGAELRTLEKVFKRAGVSAEALKKLSTRADEILGTKGVDGIGRAIDKYSGAIREAAVSGKIGTVFSQFLSLPQGAAAAGYRNVFKSIFSGEAKKAVKQSNFLKSTGYRIPLKAQLKTGSKYQNFKTLSGATLQSAQQATNKILFKSFYSQGRGKGMSHAEAIKFADEITPKLVGDRRLGMSPEIYTNLFGRVVGAFTLEPAAATTRIGKSTLDALKGNPQAIGEVMGTVVGWHYANKLFEEISGYSPLPDPIEAIADSVEYATGSDTKEKSGVKAVGRLFSEAIQFFPIFNNTFNTAYWAGETAGVFPDSRDVFGQDDNTWMNAFSLHNPLENVNRRVTGIPFFDVPANAASNFLPGGEQVLKTTQAANSLIQGAVESKDGKVRYETPDNPLRQLQMLAMGQYSIPEAREHFDNDFSRPLDKKESEAYWSLPKGEARTNFLNTKQKSEINKNKLKSGNSESGGWLSSMFGTKKKSGYSGITPTTKEEKQALAEYVNTTLAGGAVPDARDIQNGLFNGYTAKSESIEERTKVYSELNKIMNDEYLTDEQKQAVIKASGADPKDAEYYMLASKDQDVRLQEMLPIIDNMDDTQLMEFLTQGRRVIGGKQLVSNTMIDYLYENDYISDGERKALKAIKYDEIKNKFYISKSYKGRNTLTYKEALKLFEVPLPRFSTMKSVENLLAQYSGGVQQTRQQGEILLTDILNNAPVKKNRNNQLWF